MSAFVAGMHRAQGGGNASVCTLAKEGRSYKDIRLAQVGHVALAEESAAV